MREESPAGGGKGTNKGANKSSGQTGDECSGQSFDHLLKELQAVVERLESSDLPLEESLRAFERGVSLSRRGQEILDAAERKVEMLMRDGTTTTFEDDGASAGAP